MTPVELEKILGIANIPNLIVVEFKSFILDYMELGLVDQLNVENIPNYKDYLDSARRIGELIVAGDMLTGERLEAEETKQGRLQRALKNTRS